LKSKFCATYPEDKFRIRKPSPVLSVLLILSVTSNGFAQSPGDGMKRAGLAMIFGGTAGSIYGAVAEKKQASELRSSAIFYTPELRLSECYRLFGSLFPNCDLPAFQSELVTETHRRPNWIIVGSGAGTAAAGFFLFRAGSTKSRATSVVLGPQRLRLSWTW
jgi:hypothetical protein